MWHLADASHIPAILVVPSVADLANVHPVRVAFNDLLQAIGASVFHLLAEMDGRGLAPGEGFARRAETVFG